MMQSPIDDRFWRYMTHTGLCLLTARTVLSLYQQSKSAQRPTEALLERLQIGAKANQSDAQVSALRELLSLLETENQNKRGVAKNVLENSFSTLIRCALQNPQQSNVLSAAMKVISRACTDDIACRVAFVKCGGVRRLVTLLQHAHESNNSKLMEDIATALKDISVIKEGDVILRNDTPDSACTVVALLQMKNLPTMLRTLDTGARAGFLHAMVGLFSNICSLPKGCPIIARGLDGEAGVTYFTPLLENANPQVRLYAMRTIKDLSLYEKDLCAPTLADPINVRKLLSFVEVRAPALSVQPALTTIKIMLIDVTGTHREAFVREFVLCDGIQALLNVWCEHADPLARARAENIATHMKDDATFGGDVMRIMRVREHQIRARRQLDENERKQMEEMRQKRAFQSMMMAQMGMGGGDPSMMMGGMDEDEY